MAAYEIAIKDNPGYLAFEGAIFPDNWELLKKDMAECPVNTDGGCFWSANICIEKNLFEKIGGFNEKFIIAAQEDQQLKIDIQIKMEQKIAFITEAIVTHPVRFTTVRKKLRQIPIASKNFCLYAFNNKKILGYTSLMNFTKSQIAFHLKNVGNHLKKKHLKTSLVAISWLCYGLPLNTINFFLLGRKNLLRDSHA